MNLFKTAAAVAFTAVVAACNPGSGALHREASAQAHGDRPERAARKSDGEAAQTAARKPDGQAARASAAPETDFARMTPAIPRGKITVPVDVRYQFSGTPAKNRSAALQVAFVPRVAGTALRVEFPRSDAVSVSQTAELAVEKVRPETVHRQQLVVTPLTGEPAELRAIVSMDIDGSRYFGIFAIPVGGPTQ